MSFNLIWRLGSGIILASDSQTTVNQGKKIILRKTQKAFAFSCQLPLGAIYLGSAVIGQLPVFQLLSQNYAQERDSIEGYAQLLHEEIREAIKHKHRHIETTNFAINLAGFCPKEGKFQHYQISTTKLSLNPVRKVKEPLWLGGDLTREEIDILRKSGIGPERHDLSLDEAANLLVPAINQLFELSTAKVLGPAQILAVEKDKISWIEGPFTDSILDLV